MTMKMRQKQVTTKSEVNNIATRKNTREPLDEAESRTIADLQFSVEEWKVLQPLLRHLEYNDISDMVDMAYEDVVEGVDNEVAKQLAFPLFKEAMLRKLFAE